MNLSISELTFDDTGLYDELMRKTGFDIRVAIPAEITEVNFEKQTCKAQPTIRERLILRQENSKEYKYEWVELPELIEVPFFMPFGGDYNITFPIQEGDECLIVFSDLCIDAWWQNGGIQNQADSRRHDLSDGFAIVGFKSQKNKFENVSNDSLQIRNKNNVLAEFKDDSVKIQIDDTAYIEIDENKKITIKANSIKLDSNNIEIAGKNFLQHTHTNGNQGANTGMVV